ncbi:hypothetical protein BCR33DRAFT_159870 [Rhizoclosmatium globosum]|uniref:Uncharacterized protein n=1 Tax=Rhizoclosmatium globosum TaxID=329046 RepID=A0A1Y2CGM9_9FUNG|nr:hypothetical protein BCR33DRAFT_159870 [Rhizoclosmatium globosum]|eukprot:ORY46067.1 hypothetical protein BCR33DRAFT_159870 [Rhizoclosmatium globosum]
MSKNIPGCVSMKGSSVCTGTVFQNYMAWVDPAANVFYDLSTFDAHMKTWIDDSTTFASQMTNSYQCPGWTGAGLRYHITAYCGVFAYMGSMKNCSAQTNTASAILTPVCQATVTNFITSWKEVMSNPSVCSASPTPDGADGRSKYLALFTQLNQMSNSGCTVAVDLDADTFCGYKTLDDGQKYCQTNWDPCCAYNGLTQVLPSPPAPVATTTPTPASPAGAAIPICQLLLVVELQSYCSLS